MIPEKVLVNLKILSKIQKNDKITKSYDGIISLDSYQHLQFVKRTLYGDSRFNTVHEIHSIINESIVALNTLFDSKLLTKIYQSTQEWYSVCEDIRLLLLEMYAAKKGIINLKFTYIQDLNINAKLDVYIGRISNIIRDSIIKFKKYSSDPILFDDIDPLLSSIPPTHPISPTQNYLPIQVTQVSPNSSPKKYSPKSTIVKPIPPHSYSDSSKFKIQPTNSSDSDSESDNNSNDSNRSELDGSCGPDDNNGSMLLNETILFD